MIASSRLIEEIEQNRLVYVGGTYGSGKTLLATAIAERYYRRGYRVLCNYPCVFNSDITSDMLDDLWRCVIVLDEAGARLLDARSWSSSDSRDLLSVMDYCRKQDLVFVMPSATPVDKRARRLSVIRNLRAGRFLSVCGLSSFIWLFIGIPSQDQGFQAPLLCPYAYFGTYDTMAIPGPFQDALALLLQRFQRRVTVDAEATQEAARELTERLEAGETIEGLRSW